MQTIYYKAQRLAQSQLEVMISRAPVPCLSRQEEERDFWRSRLHRAIFMQRTLGSFGIVPFRCLTSEAEIRPQLAAAQTKVATCRCITTSGISSDALSVDFFRLYWGTCGAIARMSPCLACLFFGVSYQLAKELGAFVLNTSALEMFSRLYENEFFIPTTRCIYETSTPDAFWGPMPVRQLESQALAGQTLSQARESSSPAMSLQRHYMQRSCRATVHDLAQKLARQGFHSTSLARQVWLRTSVCMATAKNLADAMTSGGTMHYPSLKVSSRKVMSDFFERAMVRALGGDFSHVAVADAIVYATLLTVDFFDLNSGYCWLDYFERRAAKLLKGLTGGDFFEDINNCGERVALPAQITSEGR